MVKKILRQGLITTISELRKIADDLEKQNKDLAEELGLKEMFGHKWQIDIINKQPSCSDTWEFEV